VGKCVQPDIPDFLRERENQVDDPRGAEMSKAADQPLPNAFIKVVDLLVESRIRIDAMEQIMVKTNPVAYEFYLGTIENLRAQKAAELKKTLTVELKSKLRKG
jgi:hypothetical protein